MENNTFRLASILVPRNTKIKSIDFILVYYRLVSQRLRQNNHIHSIMKKYLSKFRFRFVLESNNGKKRTNGRQGKLLLRHCTCMNGKAEMCISVLCSPPDNCRKYHVVTNKCCEFLCLDGDMQTGLRFFNKTILTRGEMKTYSTFSTSSVLNFVGAVRLFSCAIISAFLLIVFCVGCRQFRARREAVSGGRNGNGGGIGNGTNASTPFGFIEPPPPYTFWKPPEQQCPANGSITGPYPIGPGEAPPSYEETIGPNANQHSQQLPAIFQPSPTGATSETIVTMANNMNEMPPQPGINPQVQHLYQQQNQTPYQPMPIQPITNGGNSIINHSMNHHLFGDTRPSLINQQPIQTLPTTIGNNSNTSTARVISLTNAHLANLNTQPQSISANNNNNNNNNMGEESLSSTQTIRSNHKTHSYHMANIQINLNNSINKYICNQP
ncbi:hypothetical protein BLOT_011459 [Blomia tropicalis]|nr:hypothetical protein BLOT_011459 [Blomia tropicalis]